MRQLNVTVKDKNTIILAEDGKAGDYINLAELANVDFTQIEDLIEKGKDKVYEKKLAEFKEYLSSQKEAALNQQKDEYRIAMVKKDKEHESEIAKLNEKISNFDSAKNLEVQELVSKYELMISELNSKYSKLEETLKTEVKNSNLILEQKHQAEVVKLNEMISVMKSTKKLEEQQLVSKYELTISELKSKQQEL